MSPVAPRPRMPHPNIKSQVVLHHPPSCLTEPLWTSLIKYPGTCCATTCKASEPTFLKRTSTSSGSTSRPPGPASFSTNGAIRRCAPASNPSRRSSRCSAPTDPSSSTIFAPRSGRRKPYGRRPEQLTPPALPMACHRSSPSTMRSGNKTAGGSSKRTGLRGGIKQERNTPKRRLGEPLCAAQIELPAILSASSMSTSFM